MNMQRWCQLTTRIRYTSGLRQSPEPRDYKKKKKTRNQIKHFSETNDLGGRVTRGLFAVGNVLVDIANRIPVGPVYYIQSLVPCVSPTSDGCIRTVIFQRRHTALGEIRDRQLILFEIKLEGCIDEERQFETAIPQKHFLWNLIVMLCPRPHRVAALWNDGSNFLSVHLSVPVCLCPVPGPKSRTEGSSKLKIGMREANGWPVTLFRGSRVQG